MELTGSSSRSLRMTQDSGPKLLDCRLRTTGTGRRTDTHNKHMPDEHGDHPMSRKMHFRTSLTREPADGPALDSHKPSSIMNIITNRLNKNSKLQVHRGGLC